MIDFAVVEFRVFFSQLITLGLIGYLKELIDYAKFFFNFLARYCFLVYRTPFIFCLGIACHVKLLGQQHSTPWGCWHLPLTFNAVRAHGLILISSKALEDALEKIAEEKVTLNHQ